MEEKDFAEYKKIVRERLVKFQLALTFLETKGPVNESLSSGILNMQNNAHRLFGIDPDQVRYEAHLLGRKLNEQEIHLKIREFIDETPKWIEFCKKLGLWEE